MIGLHVIGFALLLVTRELAEPFSSILRIMAWEASRRLMINREDLVGRNHCVGIMQSGCMLRFLGQASGEYLYHPQASSRLHRNPQHLCLQLSSYTLEVIFLFACQLFSKLIEWLIEGGAKLGCRIDLQQILLYRLAIDVDRRKIGCLVKFDLDHAELQLVPFILIHHFTASNEEIKIQVFLLAVRPKLFQFRSLLVRNKSFLFGVVASTHWVVRNLAKL